ncbi:hypothetical protein [Clostridium lundense]|uniref:hypothetical protein n=1 Tax=Clostridium lundense TaxID=319475 RepID=UPI000485137D|nr:hypothetical protein [Clostridium lundense]
MLLDSKISIAIKNESGKYIIRSTCFFKLKELNKEITSLNSIKIFNGEILFNIRCPLCGEIHCYKYSLKELVLRDILIGGCDEIGIPIFYIGNYEKIKRKILNYDNINKDIYAMI